MLQIKDMCAHWITAKKVSKQDQDTIREWKNGQAFQGGQPTSVTSSEGSSASSTSHARSSDKPSTSSSPPKLTDAQPPVKASPARPMQPDTHATQPTPARTDPFLRTFFVVDNQGNKIVLDNGAKPPKLTLAGGAKASLADVAKKAVHHMLKRKQCATTAQHTQPPASVQAAVQRAIAQNFMCGCSKGVCTNTLRCNEASEAQARAFLQKYAHDATTLHTDPVTVYLAEQGKPGVREFRGGYRMVLEPSRDFIRQGYTTSVDATYVQTLHLTHVPQ